MFHNKLNSLISRNEITPEDLAETVYNTMLFNIFEMICLEMKEKDIKQSVLSRFHQTQNHNALMSQITLEFTGSSLSEEECETLLKWLIAYFRKDGRRIKYPRVFKLELLEEQCFLCNICKKEISLVNSELDHIIPWDFVGDELEDNLQMLCNTCNERKGRSINFNIKMLLIKYNGQAQEII